MDEVQLQELQRWRNQDWREDEEDNSCYKSYSKLIAIGGCGRSGTTLLRVMLDSHSRIASGPESELFLPIPIRLDDLAHKFDLPLNTLTRLYNSSASRAEFVEGFKDCYLASSGRSIWVDKTARNVHRFAYILKHFPNAKIIHVLRDGRDVISSLRTHRRRRLVDGVIRPTGYVMPLQNCIERWITSIEDGLKHRHEPNYLEVKYEDLVLDTDKALRAICAFLQVSFEENMLIYHMFGGPSRDFRKFPQNIEATKPIFASSIGRWRRDLSEEEIAAVTLRIQPYLNLLQYA
ncbi:MAG: sulfotransferase [Gammaproteobacteria bacterium]|nr:sulfotransferase [Gammaproteobacteria bacterium]